MSYYRILVSDMEEKGFHLIIEANANALSNELSQAILAGCSYPSEQLSSFLLCNEQGVRSLEVIPDETFIDEHSIFPQIAMEQLTLEALLERQGGLQCLFLYDFIDEKGLCISVLDKIDGAVEILKVVAKKGDAPQIEALGDLGNFVVDEDEMEEEDQSESNEYCEEEFIDEEAYSNDLY